MLKTRKKFTLKHNKTNKDKQEMCEKIYQKHHFNKTKKMVYDEKDYYSNDGMLTTVWGPSMWHFLHTMSFNYPVNPTELDKKHYMNFILHLRWVLPCGKCRNNLKSNFKRLPLQRRHMKSRDTFSRYIFDLHELINTMLNKNSGLTYEIVRERYEHFRSRCTKDLKEIKMKAKENGCVEPLYGEKSKCILKIVPQKEKCPTFQIDKKCIKKKL